MTARNLAPKLAPRALRENPRTLRRRLDGDGDVTRSRRREPEATRFEAGGCRDEVRKAQKGCGSLRFAPERAPALARGSRPWEVAGRSRKRSMGESLRGERSGSRTRRGVRNALERRTPREHRAVGSANPRPIVTDLHGEQGPEVEVAERPPAVYATEARREQRQEGNGRREALRLRGGERLRRGEPQERYRSERIGRIREDRHGTRVRNPEAVPKPERGKLRISGFPLPQAL